MCLEVKKQKAKKDWFICTLKYSKQCTCKVFIRGWNKKNKERLMCLELLKQQERCTVNEFSSYTTSIKARGTVLVVIKH